NALHISDVMRLVSSRKQTFEDVVFFVDACRNVPGEQWAPQLDKLYASRISEELAGFNKSNLIRNGVVLFSASPGERSYSRNTSPVGYFTWAIIKGLIGEAADSDRVVRSGHLAEYVRQEVPQLIKFDFLRILH